jgi:hypothetical protein
MFLTHRINVGVLELAERGLELREASMVVVDVSTA